jgi:hypothetical protein
MSAASRGCWVYATLLPRAKFYIQFDASISKGMPMRNLILIAATALLYASSVLGEDKITRCHREGNDVVCEEKTIRPSGYWGNKKWCLFMPKNVLTGTIALCGYDKKGTCKTRIIPADAGKCVKNPKIDDEDDE